MIEYSAPINTAGLQPESLQILAGGGNISSFDVTNEALAVPEPATPALLGGLAVGLFIASSRRRRTQRGSSPAIRLASSQGAAVSHGISPENQKERSLPCRGD